MKKKLFNIAFFVIIILFSGCSVKKEETLETASEEVVITAMFRSNPETGIRKIADIVNQFNLEYEGRYRLEVNWVTYTESNYRRKIKELNALDQLPDIIKDIGFDDRFYRLMLENDRLIDVKPYIEQSPEWKAAFTKEIYEDIIDGDGIYQIPLGNLMNSSIGFVYNKELLKQAGYEEFPNNWDDFQICMERLKQQEITPLALHGAGQYWVPMLISTAYCCYDQEDEQFFHIHYPTSYDNAVVYKLFKYMKSLYSFTYEDALSIDYTMAERRFLDGEAAIIANGSWIFASLSDDEVEKYGYQSFPGNMMIGSWQMSSWAIINNNQSEEEIEAAAEFMKFKTLMETRDINGEYEQALEDGQTGGLLMYTQQVMNIQKMIPNYQIYWEQDILDGYMTTRLPDYINSAISIEELIQGMDKKVEELVEIQ